MQAIVESPENGNTTDLNNHHGLLFTLNDLPTEVIYIIFSKISPMLYPLLRHVCEQWNRIVITHFYDPHDTSTKNPTLTSESVLCWFIQHQKMFSVDDATGGDGSHWSPSSEREVALDFLRETCPRVFSPSVTRYGLIRSVVDPSWRWIRKEMSTVFWTANSIIYGFDSKKCALQQHKYLDLGDPTKRIPVIHIPESLLVAALRSGDRDTIEAVLFQNAVGVVKPIGETSEVEEVLYRLTTIAMETGGGPPILTEVFADYLNRGPLKRILETERNNMIKRYFCENEHSFTGRRTIRLSQNNRGFLHGYDPELLILLDKRIDDLLNVLIDHGSLDAIRHLYRFDIETADALQVSRNITSFYRMACRNDRTMDIQRCIEFAGRGGTIAGERIHIHIKRALAVCRWDVGEWLYDTARYFTNETISEPEQDIETAMAFKKVVNNRSSLKSFRDHCERDIWATNFSLCYSIASHYSHDSATGQAVWAGKDDSDYHYVRWLHDKLGANIRLGSYMVASTTGNTRLLRFFRDNKRETSFGVPMTCPNMAALFGHYDTFVWLVRHRCPWNEIQIASMLKTYVERPNCRNHRRILEWIHEHGKYGPGVEYMRWRIRAMDPYAGDLQCPYDCESDNEDDGNADGDFMAKSGGIKV